MAVFLSLFAGAGQQFFTNAGVPLAGGKIFTYGAGGSTPQATYTTSAGNIAHSNPIVLDAAGRVPGGGEIWLTSNLAYKFVLQTSANVTVQTLDNVSGGVDGASLAASSGASLVGFIQSGSGAVATTVQAKLRETVSAVDFGADPTGLSDSTVAIANALATGKDVMLTDGTYKLAPVAAQTIANQGYQRLFGEGSVTLSVNLASSIDLFIFNGAVALENLTIDFNNSYARYAFKWSANAGHITLNNLRVRNLKDIDSTTGSITFWLISTGNTFEINGLKAFSMLKRGNGTITDAAGSYNFVYVGGGTGATQGSISDVFVNTIHNINSSDAVIYEDTAVIYVITDASDSQNRVSINNVQGVNFGKRLLKIHASNVTASNITGYSTEGDSLGVITFLSGEGIGDKYGNAATNCYAYGLMEYAFAGTAIGIKWTNIIASVQKGNKAGMLNAAFGLGVLSDNTYVNGFWSDSERDIGIGSSTQVISNTTLRDIQLIINSTKATGVASGIHNLSSTTGLNGLFMSNITATVASNAPAAFTNPINLNTYFNGTTKVGKNIILNGLVVQSNGPLNSYAADFKYCTNLTIQNVEYLNTSGLSHFRIIQADACVNVNVDNVTIEGTNQIGVFIKDGTGRNTVSNVYNASASVAAVYNSNTTDIWVNGCNQSQVDGVTTATWQYVKYTVNTTANRPTTGRVTGYAQSFDTTLGKPIWWNGTNWVDATGTVV